MRLPDTRLVITMVVGTISSLDFCYFRTRDISCEITKDNRWHKVKIVTLSDQPILISFSVLLFVVSRILRIFKYSIRPTPRPASNKLFIFCITQFNPPVFEVPKGNVYHGGDRSLGHIRDGTHFGRGTRSFFGEKFANELMSSLQNKREQSFVKLH